MPQKKPTAPKRRPAGPPPRRNRGFEAAGHLLDSRIKKAGASRGFALTRLLTRWEEIVGIDLATMAQPVEISHTRSSGLGATLTLLTSGAQAPLLEMEKPKILEKVNACYGYRAISRVRITQTAATGFAEAQARFTGTPPAPPAQMPQAPAPDPVAEGVSDTGLRSALERLGQNIRARST